MAASISDSVGYSLAPSPKHKPVSKGDVKRIVNRPNPTKVKESDKPSEKLKKRQKEEAESRTLGQALAEASAMIPAGDGPVSRGLKATVSGAAAGATLGEYVGQVLEKRRQAGKQRKPRTLSEKASEAE